MLRIRKIEEAIADRYPEQKMRCPTHLSIGQEAIAVGVCESLRKTDKVFSGHRAHAHYLAKGGNLPRLIAELYGKQGGCCNGRGGSMHLQDLEAGFIASTSIVGGVIPLAVGCAWAEKLKGTDNVTVVFFGDGCLEEGVIHEVFNFTSLHNLPIVFVMENNGLAVTTPESARKSNKFDTYGFVESYGLQYWSTDGQDVDEVLWVARTSISRARQSKPQFIEFQTERQRVHCGVEHEYVLKHDPVKPGTAEEELAIQQEIEAAFKFAEESPIPTNPDRGIFK